MLRRLVLVVSLLASGVTAQDSPGTFQMAATPTPAALSPIAERGVALAQDDERPLEERLSEMRTLVAQDQQSGTLMTAYGELLSKSGDDPAAMIAFEQAAALDPTLYTPWIWIGILAKRGNPEPDLARAESALRKALELGAPKARGLNELAVTVALAGRMKEARDLWTQAVADDPEWGVLYGNLVKAALSLGDEETAKAQIAPALAAERFNEAVIMQYGTWLAGKDRLADAEALYRQALEAHPLVSAYHMALGRVLVDLKRPDAAIECFQSAKRLAKREGGSTVAQQAEWEIFRIENPKDEQEFQSVRDLVFTQETDRRKLERNYKKAISRLTPLIEKHPNFWNAHFVRGVAYRRLDERSNARTDLNRVLELNPEEANATMELALMTRDDLEFKEASRLAERAVELAPRDPIFALNAGFIMIEADNCPRAWELYRQALRMVGEQNTAPLRDMLNIRCPESE